MTLSELGAQFREARVHRGLLIEDVAKNLKISSKTLRALENGDRDDLPQLVFIRGFIKSYGVFLGFSQTDLQNVIHHLEETEPKVIPKTLRPDTHLAKENNKLRDSPPYKMIAAIVIMVVISFGGAYAYYNYNDDGTDEGLFAFLPDFSTWSFPSLSSLNFFSSEPKEEEPVKEQAPQWEAPVANSSYNLGVGQNLSASINEDIEEEILNPNVDNVTDNTSSNISTNATRQNVTNVTLATNTNAKTNTTSNTTGNTTANLTSNNTVRTNITLAANATTNVTSNRTSIANATAIQNVTAAPVPAPIPEGMQSLLVNAIEDCWIGINIDNKTKRDILLKKGNSTSLAFEKTIELRLGNAGGVVLNHNGTELPSPGRLGQIATFKLP